MSMKLEVDDRYYIEPSDVDSDCVSVYDPSPVKSKEIVKSSLVLIPSLG